MPANGDVIRDITMPRRAWMFSIFALIMMILGLHAFGIFTIDFYNSTSLLKFFVIIVALAILQIGFVSGFNMYYENATRKNEIWTGIGFWLLFCALGYFIYCFIVAIGLNFSLTYIDTLISVILNHWLIFIPELIIGYLTIYQFW